VSIVAPPKLLVPIPEAQIMLGDISRSHLYGLIERKEIQKVNVGRRSFVTAESITAYVARLAGGA
jgi:tRNA G10  N-methylase Trm11